MDGCRTPRQAATCRTRRTGGLVIRTTSQCHTESHVVLVVHAGLLSAANDGSANASQWPVRLRRAATSGRSGSRRLLSRGPEHFDAISGRLGLHPRSARDFLDSLVALGFLTRNNDRYANTPETDLFLDRKKPSYVGGMLEMANHRLYPFWGHLTEALRTGAPQNELRTGGPGLFETLYGDLPTKKMLIKKAFDAIPAGGALIVYEAIIDDDRSKNAFGLMMSLNMLIESPGGFDYTGADCAGWMKEAGFSATRVEHLVGPDSMVVGIK